MDGRDRRFRFRKVVRDGFSAVRGESEEPALGSGGSSNDFGGRALHNEQTITLLVFTLIAASTVAVPVIGYLIVGERADEVFVNAAPSLIIGIGGQVPDPGAASMARSVGVIAVVIFMPRMQALFVFSTAALGLATGALPRWAMLVSYLLGIWLLVNFTFFTPSVYLFPSWVALISIELLLRRHSQPAFSE